MKQSSLPAYHKLKHNGFWRGVVAKTYQNDNNLVIVQVNDQAISSQQIEVEKQTVRDLFLQSGRKARNCVLLK